ncbi:MAG: DUF2742 domain-containing protein [Gordonia polyisoprenivorans]|nr:DUF2742 domain-containing protein [Gordonia polyisoprenivorans]
MTDHHLSWDPVAAFVRRRVSPCPVAGTPEWVDLDDTDPAKLHALLVAGSRWVLERDLAQRDHRQAALKDAALDISTAAPWGRIASRIRERDEFYRANPDLRRKAS